MTIQEKMILITIIILLGKQGKDWKYEDKVEINLN